MTDAARRAALLRELGLVSWVLRDASPAGARSDVATSDHVTDRDARIAALDAEALARDVAGCEACGLCATRRRTVVGVGSQTARWMLVGEAPGAEEDARGEPFVGQAGRLLDRMLAALGLARGDDVYIANVLKCRPPQNRDPLPEEIAACVPYLHRQIALIRPRLLVLLGRFAAQTLLATEEPIARLRGRVHTLEFGDLRVPAVVTYHPAYLLRNLHDKSRAWADWNLALDTSRAAEVATVDANAG